MAILYFVLSVSNFYFYFFRHQKTYSINFVDLLRHHLVIAFFRTHHKWLFYQCLLKSSRLHLLILPLINNQLLFTCLKEINQALIKIPISHRHSLFIIGLHLSQPLIFNNIKYC